MVSASYSPVPLAMRLALLVLVLTSCRLASALHADGGMTTQELEMAEKGTFSYTSLSHSDTELLFENYCRKYNRNVRDRQ